MNVTKTKLPGALILEPRVFGDPRGYFFESYNALRYQEAGIKEVFVQDNVIFSRKGVLRGLHWQKPYSQGKLVSVATGTVVDIAVDIRHGSPTFGQWVAVELSEENHRQFYIPAGFAHGFCVISETAHFVYKCTETYHPEYEHTIMWNDPDLNINWPISTPQISEKDQKGVRLRDISPEKLICYEN